MARHPILDDELPLDETEHESGLARRITDREPDGGSGGLAVGRTPGDEMSLSTMDGGGLAERSCETDAWDDGIGLPKDAEGLAASSSDGASGAGEGDAILTVEDFVNRTYLWLGACFGLSTVASFGTAAAMDGQKLTSDQCCVGAGAYLLVTVVLAFASSKLPPTTGKFLLPIYLAACGGLVTALSLSLGLSQMTMPLLVCGVLFLGLFGIGKASSTALSGWGAGAIIGIGGIAAYYLASEVLGYDMARSAVACCLPLLLAAITALSKKGLYDMFRKAVDAGLGDKELDSGAALGGLYLTTSMALIISALGLDEFVNREWRKNPMLYQRIDVASPVCERFTAKVKREPPPRRRRP